jgi:hypothetical protein
MGNESFSFIKLAALIHHLILQAFDMIKLHAAS